MRKFLINEKMSLLKEVDMNVESEKHPTEIWNFDFYVINYFDEQ